ncbi:MAG: ABC transporter ATP-binding protein [Thermodesulfobacteriota bacterium]
MTAALLECLDLTAGYHTRNGFLRAVDGVSFRLETGQNLGLVGESGCGKSSVAKAILQVFPRNFDLLSGKILFQGRDLALLNYEEMRPIRWKEISFIPQSSMNALDPVYKVGRQIREAILEHEKLGVKEADKKARALLALVGIKPERAESYPHQLSGGMKQRVNIAMALALKPSLIIADEPTTALDVLVQDRVFQRLHALQREIGCSLLLITHDIALVAENCDQVAVMYAGRIVEAGPVDQVLNQPYHPYTLGLKNAFPSLERPKDQALISIPKSPPVLIALPDRCRFAARCPFAAAICRRSEPPYLEVDPGHRAACHRAAEADRLRIEALKSETWVEETVPDQTSRSARDHD